MRTIKLTNQELAEELTGGSPEFPKYTSQIMNLANQNAQGTRPKVVGQMTELFKEFPGSTFDEWLAWYEEQMPDAIDAATARVSAMVEKLKEAIQLVDERLVREWVEDLVLVKTFTGLGFQEAILSRIAQLKGTTYRRSTSSEESRGIDGYIGEQAVSVKPSTYSAMDMLPEAIDVALVHYEKKKAGIAFTFDF